MDKLFVSVIIPCRDEEKYIRKCLDSILAQDYPSDRFEILVAEGMSSDQTRRILVDYSARHPKVKWFENQGKIVPTGLNILIRKSLGEIICRMDAHADYPKEYISKCVSHLVIRKVDNVGGMWRILPASSSARAQAIALALSSFFGAGNAHYRLGKVKTPRRVDTVPFGCFRRDVFDKYGLFDEDMHRNEDDEFNFRLAKDGGEILLVPEIISNYHARESLDKLWRMQFQYGYFKPLGAMKVGKVMTWRQLVPGLFVASLFFCAVLGLYHPHFWEIALAGFGMYVLANLMASLYLAFYRGLTLFPHLVLSFFCIHFGYGIGYLRGILDFVILKQHLRNKARDIPLSR